MVAATEALDVEPASVVVVEMTTSSPLMTVTMKAITIQAAWVGTRVVGVETAVARGNTITKVTKAVERVAIDSSTEFTSWSKSKVTDF